jgi:hypothetical protein
VVAVPGGAGDLGQDRADRVRGPEVRLTKCTSSGS